MKKFSRSAFNRIFEQIYYTRKATAELNTHPSEPGNPELLDVVTIAFNPHIVATSSLVASIPLATPKKSKDLSLPESQPSTDNDSDR